MLHKQVFWGERWASTFLRGKREQACQSWGSSVYREGHRSLREEFIPPSFFFCQVLSHVIVLANFCYRIFFLGLQNKMWSSRQVVFYYLYKTVLLALPRPWRCLLLHPKMLLLLSRYGMDVFAVCIKWCLTIFTRWCYQQNQVLTSSGI